MQVFESFITSFDKGRFGGDVTEGNVAETLRAMNVFGLWFEAVRFVPSLTAVDTP